LRRAAFELMTTISDKLGRAAIALWALALVVALGGVAVASAPPLAKAIKGTAVTKGTEPGDRLILNSVTGKEVKESTLGPVAKAKAADTATSATSANHANSATSATSASAVGGQSAAALRVSCPAGTTASSGVCIETGPARAAQAWVAAQTTCTNAGGRALPTAAELEQFRTTAGVTGAELTNDLFDANNAYTVNMSTGVVSIATLATATPFRCVVGASN
jgi:hypothetical protein